MNRYISNLIGSVALLFVAANAQAGIIYNINRAVGAGTISGYFETNGTLGALTESDFLDWSLAMIAPNINGGAASTSSFSGGQILYFHDSAEVSATATDILFNFSGTGSFFTFTDSGDFWCVAGSDGGCYTDSAEVLGYDDVSYNDGQSQSYSGVQSIASLASVSDPGSVPEPESLALFGLGLLGMGLVRRNRQTS